MLQSKLFQAAFHKENQAPFNVKHVTSNKYRFIEQVSKKVARCRRQLILRVAGGVCGLAAALTATAGDLFLIGDRVKYGITRAQGESCFAIASTSAAPAGVILQAIIPGQVRKPAEVVRTFSAGVAIVRIGEASTGCNDNVWIDGQNLETVLGRSSIGALQIRSSDGNVSVIHVRVSEREPGGFFSITPVHDAARLMEGMSGSRVLIEDRAAGMLLSVDVRQNRGRVIRQDHLSKLIEPFFESLPASVLENPTAADLASTGAVRTVPDLKESDLAASESAATEITDADYADLVMMDTDSVPADSIETDSKELESRQTESKAAGLVATESTNADSLESARELSRPEIVRQFFIGKQTWRNNPTIVGNRLFVGSSGRVWNEPDVLDGVYSFNLDTGEKIWFVRTDADFNDLTYINGLVVGGTDSGKVLGIGARTGKTYWTRQFYGKVYARPASLRAGVAVATSVGGLYVLDLKDGATKARSELDAGVRAGLVAAQDELWVATVSGTLYRYVGFGEVQLRRESRIYYPDEFGNELSGQAIAWYERLGKGRGQLAKFYGTPLVLDDRVILSVVRARQYDYPPVMAFMKNGQLDWIGTDPGGMVGSAFGDSRLTPASWYGRLIVADPYSNAVYSLETDSGEVVWATHLGHPGVQHWASPVVANDYVYVARHDGFLHKLQAKDGKRIWSIFIGQNGHAGRTFLADEPLPDLQSDFEWRSQIPNPIYSTPAVSEDTIVVGTHDGYVYVIKDPD
jgi:outer membrane protein assembly factor BamB